MTFPRVHILETDPEHYHVALIAIKAASDYGYEGRKAYTFYFYNRFKCLVTRTLHGWTVKVKEIAPLEV
jgi:hypothetical protein